ncbi:MAG: hypothetical protein V1928_03315 [Parcubacteria group bacterium]
MKNLQNTIKLTMNIRVLISIVLVVFIANMAVPQVAGAQTVLATDKGRELVLSDVHPMDLLASRFVEFSNEDNVSVVKTMTVIATAYTSAEEETDNTPCITANGYDLCENNQENVIAANFLKFNTKVRIPDLYGDQIFTVQDRMNARYDKRIDLWKLSKSRAYAFGKRLVKIEVVE